MNYETKHWLKQLAIAFDQFCNVLATPFSPDAWADETFSSRCWRREQEGAKWAKFWRPFVDRLLWFDKDHCYTSWLSEREDRNQPPENRVAHCTHQHEDNLK